MPFKVCFVSLWFGDLNLLLVSTADFGGVRDRISLELPTSLDAFRSPPRMHILNLSLPNVEKNKGNY